MVSETDEILALHNYSRARHGVSPLMWDYAASVWATNWAKQCIWGHNATDPYISNIAMTYPDWASVYKTWCARPPRSGAALLTGAAPPKKRLEEIIVVVRTHPCCCVGACRYDDEVDLYDWNAATYS